MRILGLLIPIIGCLLMGVFIGSVFSKVFKIPERNVDECKKDIKINLLIGWAFLILSVFTFSPLPYDPVPLRGFSTLVGGFILLGSAGYFLMHRHFRLQVLAVMALAKSLKEGKVTKAQIMQALRVGEERARAIINYLNRKNTILTTSDGTIYKGIEDEAKERLLDELDRRLVETPEIEDESCLRSLRSLAGTIKVGSALLSNVNDYSVQEIVSKVKEMFDASVLSLHSSYELWKAAQAMPAGESRERLLNERKKIINDVQRAIELLGTKLIEIKNIKTIEGDSTELTRIGKELQQGIEIARKVEIRMRDLEHLVEGTRGEYDRGQYERE